MQVLKDWAPALALFIALGGLQLTLYNGLRVDLGGRIDRLDTRVDNVARELADVRERLARVEAKLDLPLSPAIAQADGQGNL